MRELLREELKLCESIRQRSGSTTPCRALECRIYADQRKSSANKTFGHAIISLLYYHYYYCYFPSIDKVAFGLRSNEEWTAVSHSSYTYSYNDDYTVGGQ